jgi:hypothetical protein
MSQSGHIVLLRTSTHSLILACTFDSDILWGQNQIVTRARDSYHAKHEAHEVGRADAWHLVRCGCFLWPLRKARVQSRAKQTVRHGNRGLSGCNCGSIRPAINDFRDRIPSRFPSKLEPCNAFAVSRYGPLSRIPRYLAGLPSISDLGRTVAPTR